MKWKRRPIALFTTVKRHDHNTDPVATVRELFSSLLPSTAMHGLEDNTVPSTDYLGLHATF
jgi:hypothetical protein